MHFSPFLISSSIRSLVESPKALNTSISFIKKYSKYAIFKYCYDLYFLSKVAAVKEVKVEVIGPEPACRRCQTAKKVVEEAIDKLKHEGITVKVEKVNIMSKETVNEYGILISPAIAINGVVKVLGRVPKEDEIGRLIKQVAE